MHLANGWHLMSERREIVAWPFTRRLMVTVLPPTSTSERTQYFVPDCRPRPNQDDTEDLDKWYKTFERSLLNTALEYPLSSLHLPALQLALNLDDHLQNLTTATT